MRKTLALIAAATALPLMCGTALAAEANPFADVPRDHWAYDAIEQLAADNVIEGYGDGTYRGDRAITRYEMAQMVAKAMSKSVSGTDKALLDKLAAEFSAELNNLGVRVAELERHADQVKWEGMLRWRHQSQWQSNGGSSQKRNASYLTLRLEPSMEINNKWSAHVRLDFHTNTVNDTEVTSATWANTGREVIPTSGLKRAWVQYDDKHLQVLGGKIPYLSKIDQGMILDSEMPGLQVTAGNKLKVTATVGRTKRFDAINDRAQVYAGDPTATAGDYLGLEIYNDRQEKFTYGAAYHRWKNREKVFEECGASAINIYEIGAGYRFDKNFAINAAYAWTPSPKAEHEPGEVAESVSSKSKKAFNIQLNYKGANPENAGTYGVFAAYRQLGHYAVIAPTYDIVPHGMRGLEIGVEYVPIRHMLGALRFFTGKEMPDETGVGEQQESAKGFLGEVRCYF